MGKAVRVFEQEFPPESRSGHSHAFLSGVLDTLMWLLDGITWALPEPYRRGSQEADAYAYGKDRGAQLFLRITGSGATHAER